MRPLHNVTLLLPATPSAAGIARRMVLELPLPAERRDAVALVLTELVANAVEHTRSSILVVDVLVDEVGVLIEVVGDDRGAGAPAECRDPGSVRGRGLRIVSALAAAWGVRAQPGPPSVWASLSGPSADGRPSPAPPA